MPDGSKWILTIQLLRSEQWLIITFKNTCKIIILNSFSSNQMKVWQIDKKNSSLNYPYDVKIGL